MRTPGYVPMSDRDRQAIRERREWERQETEKERLAEDKLEYDNWLRALQAEESHLGPGLKTKPPDFKVFRELMPEGETNPALRAAHAINRALVTRLRKEKAAEDERCRQEINAGRPDPGWTTPASVDGLDMPLEDAQAFNARSAQIFVRKHPGYYKCPRNQQVLMGFLAANGVQIACSDTFASAYRRLKSLGLIEERPKPEPPKPAPTVKPEPTPPPDLSHERQEKPQEEGLVGIDLATGQPRSYNSFEVSQMSSETFKRVFRVPSRFITRVAYIGRVHD